ncbi:MAG: M24 family metallopeptidase [Herpetosiphon sp.]
MHEEQRLRAHEQLAGNGIERALFAGRAAIVWLTGFAPPVQVGPSTFSGGPPLVWYAAGEWTLIVRDADATDAMQSGCPVETYEGLTPDAPLAPAEHLATKLREVTAGVESGRVGIEEHALPVFLRAALPDAATVVPIDALLPPLRRRKTAAELAKMRENFALTDVGHAAARAAVRAGHTELDVWTATHTAIQQAAGRRVPLGNDCTVGRRAHQGGWPLDVEIQPGDSFVVDLSTQLHNYWSDSCATCYAGEPDKRQVAMHRTAAQALEFAISLIKPGAIAGEIDYKVRDFMRKAGYPVYPHHTGHALGVTSHEEPRIVPNNTVRIEPDMVIMLEPGIYFPGETAVRLEDAVLVTDNGIEILTNHSKGM